MMTTPRYSLRVIVIIALITGGIAAIISFVLLTHFAHQAGDLTWALVGARRWLSGENPYTPILGASPYPYDTDAPLYYPFPAVLMTLPLSYLPDVVAGSVWVGLTITLMMVALLRDAPWRASILLSVPLWAAVSQVQWSPLLVCAWYWPSLFALALAKPTLGAAIASGRLTKWTIASGAVGLIISLVLFPTWPLEWLKSAASLRHTVPLLLGPGILLSVAVVRWRHPEARLLFVLALMPQRLFFYDQLLLLLVAKTPRQQFLLMAATWAALASTVFIGPLWNLPYPLERSVADAPAGWIVLWVYGGALATVLWNTRQTVKIPEPKAL